MKRDIDERFSNYIDPQLNDCWEWVGARSRGYGLFWVSPKLIRAHRYAYEALVGEIPNGLEIDHLCRNRACVNPAHMEVVTNRENVIRGIGPEMIRQFWLGKTHCPQGHPYSAENTYIYQGRRYCRTCHKAHILKSSRKSRQRIRERGK